MDEFSTSAAMKLRASQAKFLASGPGLYAIIRTPADGFAFVKQLKLYARAQRHGGGVTP